MNNSAVKLRGIKKQRCHSGSPLAGIQAFMNKLWIPAQQTAGMTNKGVYVEPRSRASRSSFD